MYPQSNFSNFNVPYSPYGSSMDQLRPQTIQNVSQQIQSAASCYFVKSPEELAGLNVQPNVFYLGINRDKKEVYIRRMNNDGNIEVENYALTTGTEEKTDLKKILEEINLIKKKINAPELPLGDNR